MFEKRCLIPINYIIICNWVIFNINLLIVVETELLLWSSNILCLFSEPNLNAADSSIFAVVTVCSYIGACLSHKCYLK